MIRRDYILRMIEEFLKALSRIESLKRSRSFDEAGEAVNDEMRRLIGTDAQAAVRLSETELLAKLVRDEATLVVRHKTLLVTTLLKEAGDLAVRDGRAEEGRAFHLKSLNLLLQVFASGEIEDYPEFVPKVELLTAALRDAPLPAPTVAVLMQHCERIGEFARAEDALYVLFDQLGETPEVLDFGLAFFTRLAARSDDALEAGGLPRAEMESDQADLKRKRAALVR
jgi:hypothetical protein